MRTVLLLAATALALPWADSAQAIDVSGEVALASDYRYRGISLSDGHPVIQAEAIVAHDSSSA